MMIQLRLNGDHISDHDSMKQAEQETARLIGEMEDGVLYTLSMFDPSKGLILQNHTNRRINGTFYKQAGSGSNDLVALDAIEFDATDMVLLMSNEEFDRVSDNDESSDAIGLAHVEHNGPFYVHIVNEMLAFFGASDFSEIGQEALAFAREKYRPQEWSTVTVEVTASIQLRVRPGVDVDEVLSDMDYHFQSQTDGAVVLSTELTDQAIK